MKFKTHHTNNVFNYEDQEKVDNTSETTQKEALSVREILVKGARGVMPQIARNGVYLDETDFDALDVEKVYNMDEVDKQISKDYNKQLIDRKLAFLNEKKELSDKRKEEKKLKKLAAEELVKLAKEKEAVTPPTEEV